MKKIAFIGAGKMAEAILKGLLEKEKIRTQEVVLSDIDEGRLAEITARYKVRSSRDNREAAREGEVVIYAVKPRHMEEVLRETAPVLDGGKTVISIAMGKTTRFIEELLGGEIPVVRVMPNNPAMVGSGISVLSYGRYTGERDRRRALDIFSCLGDVIEIGEDYQDQAMALSGCGPAYFYLIVEALCDAGVRLGLDRSTALNLVTATMRGSAEMLTETGLHPAQLKDMVTSPGGSTIAALEAMEEGGLRTALMKGVKAAWNRAKEV